MHNGDSRAELSYIDEKGNKWYLRKWIWIVRNDPECKRVIYPTNIEEFLKKLGKLKTYSIFVL
jgi:hypothetical protein